MSLHVDVFFVKEDSQVRKKTHLTYRYDKTMKDVLSIADVLHAQFKPDNPLVENLYVKSDSAGCMGP